MRTSDRDFILLLAIPFLLSIFAAIYGYIDFSSNGILSPDLEIATFLFAFFTFIVAYVICLSIYAWRY